MKTHGLKTFSKLLFSLLTLAIFLGLPAKSEGGANVSVVPTPLEAPAVGEQLTLHVNITGGKAIAGYQVTVAFDPDALRYVSGSNAGYLPAAAYAVPPLAAAGSVTLVAASLKGAAPVDGDGTLATVTFEVVSAKAFGIQLTEVLLSDVNATALAVSYTAARGNRTDLPTALQVSATGLLPNYPNPFNPETWIPYQLAAAANVTLTIYGANGALVRTLALGHQAAGVYQRKSRAAYWDGRNELGEHVASGLYFYTLMAGDFTATGKMLIMK